MSCDPPARSSPGRKHYCATCNKSYSTNSHLRRHQATHAGGAALICPVCSRYFYRIDVARRHTKKCSKDGEVIFPRSQRGKKRTSCDSCSQRKLSCDAAAPCSRCSSSKMECTYQRLSVSTSSSLPVARSGNIATSSQGDSATDAARNPVQFLLRFTEPSPYGTSAAVLADTAGQPCLQSEPESPIFPSFSVSQLLLDDPFAWDQGDSFHTLFDFSEEVPVGQGSFNLNEQDVLAHRGIEMISELSLSCDLIKKNNPEAQVSFNKTTADSVFTETNLVQFVQVYFSRLHAYIPILHQPTFQIETAPLPLLISIFLLGSLCYPSQDAAISARDFFDLAEVYIFGHPTFRRILQQCSAERASIDEIQILQAALMIEIIQNGSSNVHTRRRLRLERHPCLVAAMRISGLLQANRRFPLHNLAGTDWQMFIYDELRLRYNPLGLATWTFFTDSIFATCFNKSPEITVSEMTGDLPCEEHLFEAETVFEYEDSVARLASATSRSQSLSELAAYFLADADPNPEIKHLFNPSATELLLCITALQSTAMASKSSLLGQCTAQTILKATTRWKLLWDTAADRKTQQKSPLTGFTGHAAELWWLTRAIVNAGQADDSTSRFAKCAPTDSLTELHEFIRSH